LQLISLLSIDTTITRKLNIKTIKENII
jgi:hypothetical protein